MKTAVKAVTPLIIVLSGIAALARWRYHRRGFYSMSTATCRHTRRLESPSGGTKPRCFECKKFLVWNTVRPTLSVPGRGIARSRGRCFRIPSSFRAQLKAFRRDEKRLAIRCLFCLCVYCPACAKKHFKPRMHTIESIERVLDKTLSKVLNEAIKHGEGVQCGKGAFRR